MNNSSTKKSHKRLLIVLSIAIITVGGVFMFSMLGKSQEERRNREYEVSLVNALKNSYEGIEEVHITDSSYESIPSDAWGAKVKIKSSFDQKSKTIARDTKATITSINNQMDTAIQGKVRKSLETKIPNMLVKYDDV